MFSEQEAAPIVVSYSRVEPIMMISTICSTAGWRWGTMLHRCLIEPAEVSRKLWKVKQALKMALESCNKHSFLVGSRVVIGWVAELRC